MPANDPLDAARHALVQDMAAQAGLVLRNVRLIEELGLVKSRSGYRRPDDAPPFRREHEPDRDPDGGQRDRHDVRATTPQNRSACFRAARRADTEWYCPAASASPAPGVKPRWPAHSLTTPPSAPTCA